MARALTAQAIERLKPTTARREVPDGLLVGLYFVIQPSGARSWAVRYRNAGRPVKLTLGPYPALDLAAARARAREALQAVAGGRDPASEKKEARRAVQAQGLDRDKFANVVRQFLDRHAKAHTKERTAEETERLFRKHVLPIWGDRRIQDIARRDVVELLDRIIDRGTPTAANRTLAAVRKLFNWALDRSIVHANPCARMKAPAVEQSRDRVLSAYELSSVWRAAERLGFPFGPFIQLLILTAQRRDEVAGLRRRELKDASTLWVIPGSRTKNGVANDVPLSGPARAIIHGLPQIGASEFSFTTTGRAPVSGYSKAKARLDAIVLDLARELDPNAEPLQPWRLHDLRRTAASGMARLGTPVNVIEAVLNHRDGQVSGVAAVYNRHSYLAEKTRALEAWASHVLSTMKSSPLGPVCGGQDRGEMERIGDACRDLPLARPQ